jgi:hypothetical protein
MQIKVGCASNKEAVLRRILGTSDPYGLQINIRKDPPSMAAGLNLLMDDGCNLLVHQDIWLPPGFLEALPRKLEELPDSWVVAGFYGVNEQGEACGHIHDRRVPRALKTDHAFPQPAIAIDGCAMAVNLAKGFRFDESFSGWDLYDTYACLRARQMGGTAWIIDCPVEHYATRDVEWRPDAAFYRQWKRLHELFPGEEIASTVYRERKIDLWKGRFEGQACWIVGKGPSIEHLRAEHFGEGPVIALNDSLIDLPELPNQVFSMQKDGGLWKNRPAYLDNRCDKSPECEGCPGMVRPPMGMPLFLHRHESLYCYPDHLPRYIFDWEGLGLPHNEFSMVCALKIGQLFGCERFKFVCFDAHATGDTRCDSPYGFAEANLAAQRRILPQYTEGLDIEHVTPQPR